MLHVLISFVVGLAVGAGLVYKYYSAVAKEKAVLTASAEAVIKKL
jgi:hypothetical protein